MNRRDFLKSASILPLVFLRGDSRPQQQALDLDAAFANVQDGGLIELPPIGYAIAHDTLSLRNKKRVTIRGNNAGIYPLGDFTNKPVVDMAGSERCSIQNLFVQGPANAHALSAIATGRTEQNGGGGNVFSGCQLEGNYTGATVYSVCAEGDIWRDCSLQTTTDKPVLINSSVDFLGLGLVESSNCTMWVQNCAIANYGNAPYTMLLKGFVSGMSIKDCNIYIGAGVGVRVESVGGGYNHYFHLSDIRFESQWDASEDCLMIDNLGEWAVGWDIERIAWAVPSQYIMQSNHSIWQSRFDFKFCESSYAEKWIHLTDSATLDGVDLIGNWDGKIVYS